MGNKDKGKHAIGEAYDTGHEIVIIGTPPEFDDSVPDDDPRRHNCDAMGCGCAHVLYRFRKPNPSHHAPPLGGGSVHGVAQFPKSQTKGE